MARSTTTNQYRSKLMPLKPPILVFGAMGAGASIMMWTVKKILWPNAHPDNPLDQLNAAHRQSLYHWYGQENFLNLMIEQLSQHDQVFHVEPMEHTMSSCQDFPSIFIHAHDVKSIHEIAVLALKKLPRANFHKVGFDKLQDIKLTKNKTMDKYLDVPDIFKLSFADLAHGDLHHLLDNLTRWLNVNTPSRYQTILSVHQLWRQGNQRIWNEYNGN